MIAQRRRILIVLGSAALLFALLAGFALTQRAAEGLPRHTPEIFLPGFAQAAQRAARIEITGPNGAFAVVQTPTGWVIPDRGNYPADFDEVRRTLISLAQLTTIAPKTQRPDWLTHLALATPPKGNGTQIMVKDAAGAVLAQLITGNSEELGDPSGGTGLFVRRPGENSAWLARAVFATHGDIGAWMLKRTVDIGPARLKSVSVFPAAGGGFTVGRATPNDPVGLEGTPPTAQPDAQLINEIGFAVATLSVEDVRPAGSVDFAGASRVIATSFDGLSVQFELAQLPDGVWARISANAAAPAAAQEAAAANARAGGWAFKVPAEKARALLVNRERVLTPPAAMARQGVMATPSSTGTP
jgi:hypothetical protein